MQIHTEHRTGEGALVKPVYAHFPVAALSVPGNNERIVAPSIQR